MKEYFFRSTCAVSSGLDLFGDKWSLLIIRDLLYHSERTFKDFSKAGENISSARLSERLTRLVKQNIISKKRHPTNKKVYLYALTQKGKDLAPILAEFICWANKYLNDHISDFSKSLAQQLSQNREQALSQFKN